MNGLAFLICLLRRIAGGDDFFAALLACLGNLPAPPGPIDPPPIGGGDLDPEKARVRLRHGNAGCTGAVLQSRDGTRCWVLTAAHCVPGVGGVGEATRTDGTRFATRVVATNSNSDLAVIVSQEDEETKWYADVAEANSQPGTAIWHMGYGVDIPGNYEEGVVVNPEDSNGQTQMTINVSSGDSGSGMYRKDNGKIQSVVCCGAGRQVWGGSVASIRRILGQAVQHLAESGCHGRPYISGYKIDPADAQTSAPTLPAK